MIDYSELDAAIIHTIANWAGDFARINQRVKDIAEPLATPDRWGRRNTERLVDRRLQALRKAGRIRYGGRDWHVIDTQQSAPK